MRINWILIKFHLNSMICNMAKYNQSQNILSFKLYFDYINHNDKIEMNDILSK